MKIVTLTSSGRKNGNTERLVRMLENHLVQLAQEKKIPLEIRHVSLFGEGIQPCRGCRACFDKGEASCPLNDSTPAIRDAVLEADASCSQAPSMWKTSTEP